MDLYLNDIREEIQETEALLRVLDRNGDAERNLLKQVFVFSKDVKCLTHAAIQIAATGFNQQSLELPERETQIREAYFSWIESNKNINLPQKDSFVKFYNQKLKLKSGIQIFGIKMRKLDVQKEILGHHFEGLTAVLKEFNENLAKEIEVIGPIGITFEELLPFSSSQLIESFATAIETASEQITKLNGVIKQIEDKLDRVEHILMIQDNVEECVSLISTAVAADAEADEVPLFGQEIEDN